MKVYKIYDSSSELLVALKPNLRMSTTFLKPHFRLLIVKRSQKEESDEMKLIVVSYMQTDATTPKIVEP